MTRSILAGLTAIVSIVVLSGTGCQSTGVGDPCTPEQEYNTDFLGFSEKEVNVESRSFQCQSRLCLVNHYRGRTTCPYGQAAWNKGNGSAKACETPIAAPVTGTLSGMPTPAPGSAGNPFVDPVAKDVVPPACSNRQAVNAVYCSCRCANVKGQTNDGANYCTCPDGYNCTQLVSSTGTSNEGLTGGYCVKAGTEFDVTFQCQSCSPTGAAGGKGDCGSAQGVVGL